MGSSRNFMEMFRRMQQRKKFVCVGLDSCARQIPSEFKDKYPGRTYETKFMFNNWLVSQTCDFACAYMADNAFYLTDIEALRATVDKIHSVVPGVPFILGCYGGGIKHSNDALADYAFNYIHADAIIVNPYSGKDGGLQSFLDYKDKGVIVLCRTSNPGTEDFQDSFVRDDEVPLWHRVAWRVSEYWNDNGNCGLLMGPTSHGELAQVRAIVQHLPIFVTGTGTQSKSGRIDEDDVREIMVNGRNACGRGIAVCASRSVIFAPNPRMEARKLHEWAVKYKDQQAELVLA